MNLFSIQDEKLKEIETLVLENRFEGVLFNAFQYKNITYNLNQVMCEEILKIINKAPSEKEEEKIVLKQYSTSAFLNQIIKMVQETIFVKISEQERWRPIVRSFLQIIEDNNYKELARLINDVISYYMMEYLWTKSYNKQVSFCLATYPELSFHLGTTCLHWWFVHVKENKLYEKYALFKDDYVIKGNEKGQEFLLWYHKLNQSKQSGESEKEFLSNIGSKLYKIDHFEKLAVTIGSFLIDNLVEYKLLKEIDRHDFTIQRATVLVLNEIYEQSLIRATSYYKPNLLPTYKRPNSKVEDTENRYKFIIKDSSSLSDNFKFTYDLTPDLEKCVDTNEVEYCINTPFFNYYLDYHMYIYNLDWNLVVTDPNSRESLEIHDFLYITFNININDLKVIFDHKKILSLLNYIKNMNDIFDINYSRQLYKDLHKKYKKLTTYIKSQKIQGKRTFKSFVENSTPDLNYEQYTQEFEKSSIFLTCYNKIAAQKYFILNFLQDAYIYKHFKFFFLEKKLTSIGRLQTIPHFISLQTNKFSRAFIVYHVNNTHITEYNFKDYIQVFSENLKYVKSKFENLTYLDFKELSMKNQEEYILSYFSKNTNMEDLLSLDFSHMRMALKTLINKKRFKKTNTALLGLSLLYYQKNLSLYENKEPLLFLDSTMSGTQHMANLFHNIDAARNGSLIGSVKYDLNHIFLNEFKEIICNKIPFIANNFLKILHFSEEEILNLNLENILFDINKKLSSNYNINIDALNSKLTYNVIETKNEYKSNLDLYFEELSKYPLEELNDNLNSDEETIKQILCLLANYNFKFILEIKTNKNIIKHILIVLMKYTFIKIEKAQPQIYDLFNHRELIKQRIMATAYGMTTFGGLQTIRHHLLNTAMENGLINISRTHLNMIADFMSNYFENRFNSQHLKYVTNFIKLSSFLKLRSRKELTFHTNYLTWTYRPKILKQIRYNVARWNYQNETPKKMKRRSISIVYKTNEIDRRKISNSFAPLVVQTIEATLMINWLILSSKINKLLKNNLNMEYYYSPNYDCFGTNFKHAAMLKLHLEECYHEIYNLDFKNELIQVFKSLPPKKQKDIHLHFSRLFQDKSSPLFWDGIITNPYFVTA